jgi:hypothetical protein
MRDLLKKTAIVYAAGTVGALANSAALQLLRALRSDTGIPATSPVWLYPRLVWGGLFGLLFLLPILPGRPLAKGLLLSLAPSMARLTLFAPAGGIGPPLAIAMVFLFNAVWGVATAYTLAAMGAARR